MSTLPSFPLTTSAWIPVLDLDTGAAREVGLTEALTRAHRLYVGDNREEDIALLRFLLAAVDAACGPADADEWDAAWHAQTLDVDRIADYTARMADRLDLFHPQHPAFQSGALTTYNRGARALHPGALGGSGGAWFHHELYADDIAPVPAAQAARWLLLLLAYDVAGIKGAAPGDPLGKGNKVYGSATGPVAAATHLHVRANGASLKDMLLLNLPPQPRASGDAPVWERETPPAPVQTRAVTGRLDMLTWPTRRIRLRPTAEGTVDAVALHEGDRVADKDSWSPLRAHDPMTAWLHGPKGASPLSIVDTQNWVKPWAAAPLLDSTGERPETSQALTHALAAVSRNALNPTTRLDAVLSVTQHSDRHRAAVSGILTESSPLGTAAQLADPDQRALVAKMARYANFLGNNLATLVRKVTGRSADQVNPRMALATDLVWKWPEVVEIAATDPDAARTRWRQTLADIADRRLSEFPMSAKDRAAIGAQYAAEPPAPAPPQQPAEPVAPRRRAAAGRPTVRHAAFGGTYSLSQISRMPQCQVTYPTLTKRVKSGWSAEEAATTPGSRGRKPTARGPQDPGTSPDADGPGHDHEAGSDS